MAKILHYLNQFFAQIGGEEKAGQEVVFIPRPVGLGTEIHYSLKRYGVEFATIACGDNYFHEQEKVALRSIAEILDRYSPDIFFAGPAFNAGRYGLACAKLCSLVQEARRIPAFTGMYEDNPGTKEVGRHLLVIQTASSVTGMREALKKFTDLLELLLLSDTNMIERFRAEHCLKLQRRFTVKAHAPDFVRSVDLLLAKLDGRPYESEIPFIESAPYIIPGPLENMRDVTLALVTEGGLVPKGNPDRLESNRASKHLKYSISGLDRLKCGEFEAMHTGYDSSTVNQDPNRLVPLDALRVLEKCGRFKKLHDQYYVTTGTGAPPSMMEELGSQIADALATNGVQGVILTAT